MYETEKQITEALLNDARSVAAEFVDLLRNGEDVANVRVYATSLIVRADGVRVTSRSTSVIGNLVADVRRAVATTILMELNEYLTRETVREVGRPDPAEWLESRLVHRLTDIVR
jgi:phage gp29-like protein